MILSLDLVQLRLLTQTYVATLPEEDMESLPTLPGVIQRLLDQAQAQADQRHYALEITAEDAETLRGALLQHLEAASEEGDLFAMGELHALMGQLDQVEPG